jgi:hypothetical protein
MTPNPHAHRAWKLLLLTCLAAATFGCNAGKKISLDESLSIRSRAHRDVVHDQGFAQGLYRREDPSSITVLLFDGPEANPNRALIVRMFWKPRAASTPLDETATNTTVQYIVFKEGVDAGESDAGKPSVGIYSGGGFLYPETDLDAAILGANLWQATLTLSDKSDGFVDELGPSIMQGRFTARRDDEAMVDALRRVNIAVSERLGVPRFVRAD